MADTDKNDERKSVERQDDSRASSASSNSEPQSGDPGRTPGSAEGDEATVDEDLRQKEREGKL